MKVKLSGAAIKMVLAQRKTSQNGLAKSMGISSAYFSQMARGVRYPSAEVQQRILDALAPLTFDDLFVTEDGQDGDRPKTESDAGLRLYARMIVRAHLKQIVERNSDAAVQAESGIEPLRPDSRVREERIGGHPEEES